MARKSKRPGTTADGGPKKCNHRQRAHANPLADTSSYEHPETPAAMDWSTVYPAPKGAEGAAAAKPVVDWVDVGCGFGGLVIALAEKFAEKYILGMEIRDKIAEFGHLRAKALRESAGTHFRADVIRANCMKCIPNYFSQGQLEKIMFCFPDPHFKKAAHRRRVISPALLAEYAFVLKEGGILYTVTDCLELHEWMVRHLEEHPLFRRLSLAEEEADPVVPFIVKTTDESIKVERNGGDKYVALFRRITNADGAAITTTSAVDAGAARTLSKARSTGRWITAVSGLPTVKELHRAYAVQAVTCGLDSAGKPLAAAAARRPHAGWLCAPHAGLGGQFVRAPILAERQHTGGSAVLSYVQLNASALEVRVALQLRSAPLAGSDAWDAVEAVFPVLTVRGSSYTCASGKGGASPFHEVADMCACAALLRPDTSAGTAGAEHVPRSGTVTTELSIGGTVRASCESEAALAEAVRTLTWLDAHLCACGDVRLRAGDVVVCGVLCSTTSFAPGDEVCVSMRGASEGALKLQFVAEEKKAAPRPHAYDKKYLPEGHTV